MSEIVEQPTTNILRKVFFSRPAVICFWLLNIVALLSTIGWILLDGEFTRVALWSFTGAQWWKFPVFSEKIPTVYESRAFWMGSLLVLSAVSFVLIALSLFVGHRGQRSLKAWLACTGLLAVWLTFYSVWPELAWRAQGWRVARAIPAAEKLVEQIQSDWPETDGSLEGAGPFMAYPIGKPRTLMFIKKPHLGNTSIQYAEIERSGNPADPAFHLQLAGNEVGAWLVRPPAGQEPVLFISGLETTNYPQRFRELAGGWYLVDYLQSSIIDPGDSIELRR